jgi:hypothetical protein
MKRRKTRIHLDISSIKKPKYKMWDPKTGGVHTSRDIIWLRRMYYQAQVNEENTTLEAEEGEEQESNKSSSESEAETDDDNNDNDDGNDDPDKTKAMTTRSGQTVKAPRRLIEEVGAAVLNQLNDPERNYYERLVEIGCVSMALVGAGVGGGFIPKSFM